MLYGITHEIDGQPIIREPRILKVGIGCPKGPAIDVLIRDGKWWVRTGFGQGKVTAFPCENRAHAERRYAEMKPQAPVCPYPRKLDYFTFTRQIADGTFEPDYDAIEAHGEKPGTIDLIFFDDEPLEAAYQYWGASELKCKGDGINAQRVLAMAATDAERDAAELAKAGGHRYFPITGGCSLKGCPFAVESTDGRGRPAPPACKPHADLKFQLAKNLRLGGTAYFTTTGRRSISQLFSSLYRFRKVTGGGDPERGFLAGIPFQMVLKPFRTNHNGQAGTAFGVSLEFRSSSVEDLLKNMAEQGMKFRSAMARTAPALLEAGPAIHQTAALPVEATEAPAELVDPGEEEIAARAFQDEFVDEGADEDRQPDSLALNEGAQRIKDALDKKREPQRAQAAPPAQPGTDSQGPRQTAPASTPSPEVVNVPAQPAPPAPASSSPRPTDPKVDHPYDQPPADLPHLTDWPENIEVQPFYWIGDVLYCWNEASGNYIKHSDKPFREPPSMIVREAPPQQGTPGAHRRPYAINRRAQ
jgi:hypothetical protein